VIYLKFLFLEIHKHIFFKNSPPQLDIYKTLRNFIVDFYYYKNYTIFATNTNY